jgi:hypothetical protein
MQINETQQTQTTTTQENTNDIIYTLKHTFTSYTTNINLSTQCVLSCTEEDINKKLEIQTKAKYNTLHKKI